MVLLDLLFVNAILPEILLGLHKASCNFCSNSQGEESPYEFV